MAYDLSLPDNQPRGRLGLQGGSRTNEKSPYGKGKWKQAPYDSLKLETQKGDMEKNVII